MCKKLVFLNNPQNTALNWCRDEATKLQEKNAQIVSTYTNLFFTYFFNGALALAIHEGFAL